MRLFAFFGDDNMGRKGSGLLIAVILSITVMGLAVTFVTRAMATSKQVDSVSELKQGMYSTEATMSDALFKLRNNQVWWWESGGKRYAWTWMFFTNTYSNAQIVDNMDAESTLDLYIWASYRDIGRTLSAKVHKIEINLDPGIFNAAMSLQLNPDAELNVANNAVPMYFNGNNCYISGQDHDLNRVALPGPITQPGLALNAVTDSTGVVDWDSFPAGQVIGNPPSTNQDTYKGPNIKEIISYAEQCYDTKVDLADPVTPVWTDAGAPDPFYAGMGNTITSNNGRFGDVNNWKVTYVDASPPGGSQFLKFSGTFKGYGLLVIKISPGEFASLEMTGKSEWTGMVVFDIDGDYSLASNNSLVNMKGGGNLETHILGGAALNINDELTISANSQVFGVAGVSGLDYSSMAIARALTPTKPIPNPTYELVTYNTEVTSAWDWGDINGDSWYYRPWWATEDYFQEGSWEDY